MKLKFLGTGTSQGVPYIGCDHPVCLSADPRDKRTRTSALVTTDTGRKILIDCGPDFRQQMLANNEKSVDAVLLTHEHNDHVIGLDDLRPVIFKNEKDMPIYCMDRVGQEVKKRFPYAFADEKYPGAPRFQINTISENFELFDVVIQPVEVQHYKIPILGFRMGDLAYITDAGFISDEEKIKLQNLDTLIINCLRTETPHISHLILPDILALAEELRPGKIFLTHMSHLIGFHEDLLRTLPANISPAYDGLEIVF